MSERSNRRILLIDDTPSIHVDFRKILMPAPVLTGELDEGIFPVGGHPTCKEAENHRSFMAALPAPATGDVHRLFRLFPG